MPETRFPVWLPYFNDSDISTLGATHTHRMYCMSKASVTLTLDTVLYTSDVQSKVTESASTEVSWAQSGGIVGKIYVTQYQGLLYQKTWSLKSPYVHSCRL